MSKQFFEKKDRKHLMLIDGNSLINRAFYASAGRTMLTTPDGTPSGAVFTFLTMFMNYKEKIQPDNIVVAFDLKDKTFRHQMYDQYKGTRKGMPDDLAVQMPLLKEMLDALNVCRVEISGFEADDLIGTYADMGVKEGYDVFIVTGDKDSFQLIRDHIFVVLPVTRKGATNEDLMNRQAFEDEYHFSPEEFVNYKAIMGDSSDNIPGVKGIGKVGAQNLIVAHSTVENIYHLLDTDPEQVDKKYRQKLIDNRADAELSYQLALINCEVPVEKDIGATFVKDPDEKILANYFSKMGFQSMFERFGLTQDTDIFKEINMEEIPNCPSFDAFLKATENNQIVWLVLKTGESLLYSEAAGFVFLEPLELQMEWDRIHQLHNNMIVWDYKKWLHDSGFEPLQIEPFDVQIAAYLLNQGKAEEFDSVFQTVFQKPFVTLEKKPSREELIDYAKHQAVSMLKLHDMQRELIREYKMQKLAYSVEMPLARVLFEMEKAGVFADKEQLDDLNNIMNQQIADLEKDIFEQAGKEFNINSSQQLSDVLFNDLGLPPGKKLASGYYSTAAGELERLQGQHPVIDLITEYREISKLNSTFVDGLRKSIDAKDGRIHTSYHQTLTTTGRLSSSDPNLQNIPVRSKKSKAIREVFAAPEGFILMGADYSQIELRLLAHLSGDQELMKAFNENVDIHTNTAVSMFGKEAGEISKRERSLAKTVNFSIVYGVSGYGLSQDLKSSVAEAKDYIDAYYDLYSEVKPYLDSLIEKAKNDGFVETLYGRRRYIPEIHSSQFFTRSFGERAAMNAPLQGTAADIIKMAMLRIDEKLRGEGLKTRMILQVHDELILEVPEDEIDQVKEILQYEMEHVVKLKVPLIAEVEIGQSWAEI